jgi:transposase
VFRKKTAKVDPEFWTPTSALPTTPANTFFGRLGRALDAASFGDAMRTASAPHYDMDASKGGAPGIDPEVFFKMLMVGFFENIVSERGIAARCADSLAIRAFLHYELTEPLPHHSSLSVIRQRLPLSVFDAAFTIVLQALHDHQLIKGKRLAIDTSVLEANASLRSLEHRLTGEEYRAYVQRLAAATGIDPTDGRAVSAFDRQRPERTTSNAEWENPHDPDAKVGPDKKGVTRMIYKPEHVVDADTGAIVEVAVTPGDQADGTALTERIGAAEDRLNLVAGREPGTAVVQVVTADMGYFRPIELGELQSGGIATAIPDPVDNRRVDKLGQGDREVILRARRTAASVAGQAALRKRGETVERSFAHVLDEGGARRTTLRGRENIEKRYFVQAACANLALLLRSLGVPGTLKQTWAAPAAACRIVWSLIRPAGTTRARLQRRVDAFYLALGITAPRLSTSRWILLGTASSTVC